MTKRRSIQWAAAGCVALALIWLIISLFIPCSDIACFRKHDPWLAERMPNVPLFITRENIQPILRYIDKPEQRAAVEATLDRLNAETDKREKKHPHDKPLTCAVVGNAGNLRDSHYGPLIDHHDYIFRMNNAPMDGYTADVGHKITYHALHSNWGKIKNYTPDTIHILYMDNLGGEEGDEKPMLDEEYEKKIAADLVLVAEQLTPEAFPPHAADSIQKFPANIAKLTGGLYLVHPDFIRAINDHWFTPDNHGKLQWPSTGFRTLMIAMYMCDQIDIFGFGKPDAVTRKWEHYYNSPGRNTMGHRPAFQEEVLMELEQRGILRRYRGSEPE